MHRKYTTMTAAITITLCFMTACTQTPSEGERKGVRVATTDNPNNEVLKEEEKALPQDTEILENSLEDTSTGSVAEKNLEILAACEHTRIEQSIVAFDGTILRIDADVDVDEIERVSRYEYEIQDMTEEKRIAFFEAVFSEDADHAEYDEKNDIWTLEIDPEIRNYFLYQLSYSNGGATIPGEQIVVLENRYYDLYPFEDNRLAALADSRVTASLEEAAAICGKVVGAVTDADDYVVSYAQAYGNGGRRPYYKIVFTQMLDGMTVTAYNNWSFLYDNDGIEKVTGSLFSTSEVGLDETILSPVQAVERLQEQAAFLQLEGESPGTVSRVTLEYLVIMTPAGEVLAAPVWRFWLGEDEDGRNFFGHKILAIDAVTGELIWEERGQSM